MANFYTTMSPSELDKAEKFRKKHWKKCKSTYYYKVIPTEIGYGIHIICDGCGKEKDITDYKQW